MSVLVLGMHRSGTSVATRMISLLGLSVCDPADLSTDRRGNERGVWESASLVRFNDRLLASAGGAWWCPPPTGRDWAPEVEALAEPARAAFSISHRGAHWVWKDPRNCLTLPFWLQALAVRPAVVVMVRHPLEVASSLTARNRFSTFAGLALWERSLREVVQGVSGLPVLVSRYDDLVGDPGTWCRTVAGFLAEAGLPHRSARAVLAAGYVDGPARPPAASAAPDDAPPQLSPEQARLVGTLEGLVGPHARFAAPCLGPETPSTEQFFAEQRHAHRLQQGPATVPPPATGHPLFDRSPAARAGRRTPPAEASVVVISRNEGRRLAETVGALTRSTPRGTEIIVVDDGSTDGSTDHLREDPRVRLVSPRERLGIARARNLGASLASGQVLVFSDAHVHPDDGWLAAVTAALDRPGAGAVNPVLSPPGSRHTVNALTFDGPHLNVRWIAEPARRDPFPVPLLAGCFLAVRREVFRAAGGFDAGMTGYGAEDLELCLRLWRMGYECLSVPGARVEHWFKPAQTHRGDRAGFLHNLLRLGSLHLAPWRLALLVTALRREPEFPRAMAAVLAGDVGRQRARTGAASWFSDDVFFERFGPGCYEVAPRASNHTPEEVA